MYLQAPCLANLPPVDAPVSHGVQLPVDVPHYQGLQQEPVQVYVQLRFEIHFFLNSNR